jgi:predicted metal-dependent HD superfamily phosphohydrolase
MKNLTLLEKTENHISSLFLNADTSGLFYHNYNHTLSVVEGVSQAAEILNLSDYETEVLIVSAWFHDIGYLYTRTEHEAKSIEIMQNALRPNYIHLIEIATTCIAATKVGVIPENSLAALLKDVDVAFGSAYNFKKTNEAFREELIFSENKAFDNETWRKMSTNFLQNIEFYSEYGKINFEDLVENNLAAYAELQLV